MAILRGILLLFVVLPFTSIVRAEISEENGLVFSSGIEYQLISQEYYNAVIDTAQIDPLETWHLKLEQIDDIILRTKLSYKYKIPSKRLNILADFEISRDRWIGRAEGFYRLGNYNNQLQLFSKIENKSSFGDEVSNNQGYKYLQTYLMGKHKLSSKLSIGLKSGLEYILFNNPDINPGSIDNTAIGIPAYKNQNYSMLNGLVFGEIRLKEFGRLIDWSFTLNHRNVPDSVLANYNQYRLNLGFSSFGILSTINIEGSLEYKDYGQPNNRKDFSALELFGLFNRDITNNFESALIFRLQNHIYRNPDNVYRDYYLFQPKLKFTRQLGVFGLGPYFNIELYREKLVEEYNQLPGLELENYSQWEAGLFFTLMTTSSIYINSEISTGRRTFKDNLAVLSSYNIYSYSIMASSSLSRHIYINLFADSSFEKHDNSNDNITLYLFSASLSTTF